MLEKRFLSATRVRDGGGTMMLLTRFVSLLCLIAVGLVQTAGSTEAGVRAGAARKSIVPPFPTQMGGFHDREKDFEGVHDDLFARALVLDNGSTKLIFI